MVILCHYTLSLQPLSPPPSEVCSDVFMCTEYIKKNSSVHYKTDSLLAHVLCWQLFQGRLASASMRGWADKCLSHETHFLSFFFHEKLPLRSSHWACCTLRPGFSKLGHFDIDLEFQRCSLAFGSALSVWIHLTLDNNWSQGGIKKV